MYCLSAARIIVLIKMSIDSWVLIEVVANCGNIVQTEIRRMNLNGLCGNQEGGSEVGFHGFFGFLDYGTVL